MSTYNDQIEAALNFDALAHAERLTGESYKTSRETEMLGVALHLTHGEQKRELLRGSNDTYWAQPMRDWIQLVEGLGFDLLHEEQIPGSGDMYRIWWHRDGLLMDADSYWGDKSVNSAKVYFNYCGPRSAMHHCSSGHVGELHGVSVWEGSRDAREGLRFALDRMRAEGHFVSPWVKTGFLWLLHYQDTKADGYDYKAITKARLDALPPDVRAAIQKATAGENE
jgi:hypothetical protein